MACVNVDARLVQGALRRLVDGVRPPVRFKVTGPDGTCVSGRVVRGWGVAGLDVRFSVAARRAPPMTLPVTVLFLDSLGNLRGTTLHDHAGGAPLP